MAKLYIGDIREAKDTYGAKRLQRVPRGGGGGAPMTCLRFSGSDASHNTLECKKRSDVQLRLVLFCFTIQVGYKYLWP